jgi:hypothetical protein
MEKQSLPSTATKSLMSVAPQLTCSVIQSASHAARFSEMPMRYSQKSAQ